MATFYIKKKATSKALFRKCQKSMQTQGFEFHPYQKQGILWMIKQEQNTQHKIRGGLLCDEMGLGKTVQTISLICARPLKKRKTLIVVPCSVLFQWQNEFTKFAPHIKTQVHHGKTKIHFLSAPTFQNADVIITTYGTLSSRKKQTILHKHTWGRIILDECHSIRNHKCKRAKSCCLIKAKHKWGLTGTPIQNYKTDLYSLFMYLGLSRTFVKNNIDDVRDTYILRRTKKEVHIQLPKKMVECVEIPFETRFEEDFYLKIRDNVLKEIGAFQSFDQISINAVLEHIMRLRQATIHPQLVIDGYSKKYNKLPSISEIDIPTKMNYIIKTLKKEYLENKEQKTIIFCSFIKEIDILEHHLETSHFRTARIDGSINPSERIKIIKNASSFDILLVQIDAGGTGLTMTHFHRIFFMSPSWNPCLERQAIARAHRIGQEKNVKITRLFVVLNNDTILQSKNKTNAKTIDELIKVKQDNKKLMIIEMLQDNSYFEYKPKETRTRDDLFQYVK